jgi:hypothetical protein
MVAPGWPGVVTAGSSPLSSSSPQADATAMMLAAMTRRAPLAGFVIISSEYISRRGIVR